MSYYSIIRFVNNPLSEENIAIGLIALSDRQVFYKLSEQKLDFAKKLNPQSAKLIEYSTKQLFNFIHLDVADQSKKLIEFDKHFNIEYLNRLSNYNNGIIQFSKPLSIKIDFDSDNFSKYFEKFIGVEELKSAAITKVDSFFKSKLKKDFYEPLKDKIDIDFTIKEKQLPSLFFNYHLDGIGVNGALYTAKSIDFNSSKKVKDIKLEISEYECLLDRLKKFADSKNISGEHKFYLIADEYKGSTPSYMDLYSIISENIMPFFKLISTDELNKVVNMVIKSKAHKFSEVLEEV